MAASIDGSVAQKHRIERLDVDAQIKLRLAHDLADASRDGGTACLVHLLR
jgi:hypothetical protein